MNRIYFDNAATTALDTQVLNAMIPYLTEKFGNPSSIYSYGREARTGIEQARKTVARILNAHPAEIFFTSGGTESNNTIITAAVRDLDCNHIITSSIEHHAVLNTVEYFEQRQLVKVSYVKLLADGHIDINNLEELLAAGNGKTLVTLMHANNEIGNMLDMNAVGALCKKYNAFFHSDTVQTIGHFSFDLRSTPVHFITGSAHKFHGPKGVGLLYINENLKIKPYIQGGGQERNMRAGTENVYGVIGFAKALEIAAQSYEIDKSYTGGLKNYMYEQLKKQIPAVTFNGDPMGMSLYTVLSASFPKTARSAVLLYNLDMNNICVSGGSACSSGADQGSHVLQGLNPADDNITIRFSFCKHNTVEEIDQVIVKLKSLM